MSRYALNLPTHLKIEAEDIARKQGISLNQFILWAVAEKVGSLSQQLDEPRFPHITYRRGPSGYPTPVFRGRSIRVQSIVIAVNRWNWEPDHVADEYEIPATLVHEALAFYAEHQTEIDYAIATEESLEVAAPRG